MGIVCLVVIKTIWCDGSTLHLTVVQMFLVTIEQNRAVSLEQQTNSKPSLQSHTHSRSQLLKMDTTDVVKDKLLL